MVPGGSTDKLLHALRVTADDIVLKGFDVLTSLSAHQTGDVVPRVLNAIAALTDEVVVVSLAVVHESGRYTA
jgi:hypothetical protein